MKTAVVGGKDALGMRKVYEGLILEQSINTIFRPFSEKYGKLYRAGSVVELRIIERPGSDFAGLEPVYNPNRYFVQITNLLVIPIRDLSHKDFLGSSPDVQSPSDLIYHLGMIYNKSVSDYNSNTKVVKINFEYLSDPESKEL